MLQIERKRTLSIGSYPVSRSRDQAPEQRTNREEYSYAHKRNEDGLLVTLAPSFSSECHLAYLPVILDKTDDIEKLVLSLKIDQVIAAL